MRAQIQIYSPPSSFRALSLAHTTRTLSLARSSSLASSTRRLPFSSSTDKSLSLARAFHSKVSSSLTRSIWCGVPGRPARYSRGQKDRWRFRNHHHHRKQSASEKSWPENRYVYHYGRGMRCAGFSVCLCGSCRPQAHMLKSLAGDLIRVLVRGRFLCQFAFAPATCLQQLDCKLWLIYTTARRRRLVRYRSWKPCRRASARNQPRCFLRSKARARSRRAGQLVAASGDRLCVQSLSPRR